MKQSDDQTLFAWEVGSDNTTDFCGPLAPSPLQFRRCGQLLPLPDFGTPAPYSMTNKGLRIELPIEQPDGWRTLPILHCTSEARYPARVTLPIQPTRYQSNQFARDHKHTGPLEFSRPGSLKQAVVKTIFLTQKPERGVISPERRLQVRNEWSRNGEKAFADPYLVPELFTTLKTDDVLETYLIPLDCRSGALIFPVQYNGTYHLILLYKILDSNQSYSLGQDGPMVRSIQFDYDVVCAILSPDSINRFVSSPFNTTKPRSQQRIYKSRLDFGGSHTGKMTYVEFDENKSLGDFQKEYAPFLHTFPRELPSNKMLKIMTTEDFNSRGQLTTVLHIDLYSDDDLKFYSPPVSPAKP
jgi:hypothetical protein